MHFRTLLFSSLSLLALATAVHAEDLAEAPQDSQEEVVITGSGYRVTKDAVMSHVDVMTRAELGQKPAGGIGDTLAYRPGIRSSGFAPGASRPVIRGLEGFRVLVLNNGMGAVDVSSLSPDHAVATSPTEAKRIEVLRGPSALAYGGNAIGGVVNIVDDRIPSQAALKPVEGTLTAQASSVDQGLQGSLNLKTGTGPWVFTVDAFKRTSEDYDTPVAPSLDPADTRTRQTNSATDMRNLGAGVSYIGDKGYGGLSYKTTDYTYGVAVNDAVEIDLHQARWDARGQVAVNLAGFNRLDAAVGYSDYHHAEIEDGEIGTQFFSKGSEARFALVRDSVGKVSGTLGVSGFDRDFQAVGGEAFVPSTRTSQAGLFTQYRYDAGVWGIEGGVRVDRTSISADGFDRDFDAVSASVGGFYRPNDHGFIGLALTRAERAPSEVELLADGPHEGTGEYVIGDAGFRIETGSSLELTGHWLIDHDNRFAVDAHVFASRFDHFIDLRPTGAEEDGLPVFQYVQTDADLYGLELEASTRLFDWRGQTVRMEAAYDYVHGETGLGPVVRLPPQALTVKLESAGPRWKSHLEVRGVADRDAELGDFETATQGYVTVNLFTSYKLSSLSGATVYAEVRNLTDAEMREATSATKDLVVGPGRNVRAGLVWNF
ncbi:TonB-dependent receptor [Asticcacaulis sp. AC460]|uniref:TonB-dependent receptor n=1 Tax=Asticcacaulis sp. AC460 TaxID=1282360 RepID=UPI00040C0138|nr:TonB-dependent receptor [Asticcacaulis sp. AC460]